MYDFPLYRPPSEAQSALIRITRGCPWNHCTFCGMYKNIGFEYRSVEEIKKDIALASEIFPHSRTVFIGDSEILLHPDIIKIVQLIRGTFPELERITAYARAHTLMRKSVDELGNLKNAGITRLHVGLESGDRNILKQIRKGATPEVMIKGGGKAKQAGFELCFYVLCGAGGEQFWQDHADGTAAVINRVNPDFIRLRTLSLVSNSPLYRSWQAGKFKPVTSITRLKETRRLIGNMNVVFSKLASDHLSNYLWLGKGIVYQGVEGVLPGDKESMLTIIDRAIDQIGNRADVLDANMLVQQGVIRRL